MIFEPNAIWELADGLKVDNLTMYLKLDIDKTTDVAVALISMHGTKYVG